MDAEKVFPAYLFQESEKELRRYYAFHPKKPLMWGMFDSWDGLGYLATDGVIAWRSAQLADFVRAHGGEEISWRSSARILGASVGSIIKTPKIASNYRALAKVRCFDVREAVGEKGFVFLTKSKSAVTADDFSQVLAAVALA